MTRAPEGPRRRGRPTTGPAAPPVANRLERPTRARRVALRVLDRVERNGAYADLALHAALRQEDMHAGDRALATELVYGTLRWRGRLDHLLSHVLDRPLADLEPIVRSLLRIGAYQIVFLDRVPAATAVDQTVRSARAAGVERAAGLANAVLRRLAREHAAVPFPSLEDDPVGHMTHALSLPGWLAAAWVEQFGAAEAADLARALNGVPPLTVRANRQRTSRDTLLAELRTRFPDARPGAYGPDALVLGHAGAPGTDPAFRDGRFTVQDEASQLVACALGALPGERVLDVCAAPGAKATALAEAVGPRGSVLALDRHSRRLDLVARDARRLGIDWLTARVYDASRDLAPIAPARSFDRVLVDAPCSGLGTLRRNPDARWRVRPEQVADLASAQFALLERAAAALRPGGALVYSTCTLSPEENEAVVRAFLAGGSGFRVAAREAHPGAVRPLLDADGFLRCWPHRHGTDGFFAARLERTP
jgi:16S rRNA (cytosine967-C5)-methyltransferase